MRISRALALALTVLVGPFWPQAFADTAPVITQQPGSQLVAPGSNVQFSVTASGTAPLFFQWSFGATNLAGATNATLNLTNVGPSQVGSYSVVVTNSAGAAVSDAATLGLSGPPVVVTPPPAQSVVRGVNVTFSVVASGTPPLAYFWLTNGVWLGGSTNASLTLTNVSPTNAASYSVLITNAFGSVTTTPVRLEVAGPPLVIQPPTNTMVYPGENASFSVSAYSTTPVTYSWVYGTTGISGATNSTLVVTNATTNIMGYYFAVVSNPYGSTESYGGYLTVNPFPQPTLRLGAPSFVGTSVSAPVYFLAYGIETNLSFSLLYNPAAAAQPVFSPNTNNLPSGTVVSLYPTNGALGVSFNLPTNQPFYPGETNLGVFSVTLLPEGAPFAAGLGLGGAPTPLVASPLGDPYTNVVVLPLPPNLAGPAPTPVLSWQTGLFEQAAVVVNSGDTLIENVLVIVQGLGLDTLTNQIYLANSQGYLGTNPIISLGPLAPTETKTFTLEYYVSDRTTAPDPTFLLYATGPFTFTLPTTAPSLLTTNRFFNGTNGLNGYLVDFPTQTNQVYYVEYVSSLNDFTNPAAVHIALPSIQGTGSMVQWLDDGPPKTISAPVSGSRFYKILQLTETNIVSTNIVSGP